LLLKNRLYETTQSTVYIVLDNNSSLLPVGSSEAVKRFYELMIGFYTYPAAVGELVPHAYSVGIEWLTLSAKRQFANSLSPGLTSIRDIGATFLFRTLSC
jgi:hypothetical protein